MAVGEKVWLLQARSGVPANRGRIIGLLTALIFWGLATGLVALYRSTQISVTLAVDGQVRSVRTHQTTVGGVLREVGLTLHAQDITRPELSEHLSLNMLIAVYRARPVVVEVDGRTIEARTQLTQTGAILTELGIAVSPHDVVHQFSDPVAAETNLSPLRLQIERAVPVIVQEANHLPLHLYTTASSVGQALYDAGIILYLADDVRPSLSSPVKPGTHIHIERSVPVTIHVDGHTLQTRTRRFSVGEVLSDFGISLQGLDQVAPDLNAPLGEGQEIRVTRVREEVLVQQEPIPFETQWAPDPELEIDHTRVGQEGQAGVFERRIRVRYEDGVEVGRWVEAEWVARPPQPKILSYGTQIVLRTIDTPSGPVQYWRKYRMLATSYNAASSGKPADHPRYGVTAIGWNMRYGIVAVDPSVIPLRSQVYVPGYGVGDAGDTGGAIKGLRIDLGYDDNNLVLWYRCVDVYLLAPVPGQVEYVAPALVHPRCR